MAAARFWWKRWGGVEEEAAAVWNAVAESWRRKRRDWMAAVSVSEVGVVA